MSFSFNFKAADKVAAKAQAETEFDKVVAHQPAHASDKAAALANVGSAIDLVVDDASKDLSVGMNGWVSYAGQPGDPDFQVMGVAVQCSVALIDRSAPPPAEAEQASAKSAG